MLLKSFFGGSAGTGGGISVPRRASDFLKGVLKDTRVVNIEVFTFRC